MGTQPCSKHHKSFRIGKTSQGEGGCGAKNGVLRSRRQQEVVTPLSSFASPSNRNGYCWKREGKAQKNPLEGPETEDNGDGAQENDEDKRDQERATAPPVKGFNEELCRDSEKRDRRAREVKASCARGLVGIRAREICVSWYISKV